MPDIATLVTHAIAIITNPKSQAFPAGIAMKSQFYRCFRSRGDIFLSCDCGR